MRAYLIGGLMLSACSLTSSFDDFVVVVDAGPDSTPPDAPDAVVPDNGQDAPLDSAPDTETDTGVDGMVGCANPGEVMCSAECVMLGTSEHCSACDDACEGANVCSSGECLPPDFTTEWPSESFTRFAIAQDVAVASDGRVYVVGFISGDGSSGLSSSSELFVAEFSGTLGTRNWVAFSRTTTTSTNRAAGSVASDVQVDGDSVYVAARTGGTLRVVDSTGRSVSVDNTADGQVSPAVLRFSRDGALVESNVARGERPNIFEPLFPPRLALTPNHVNLVVSTANLCIGGRPSDECMNGPGMREIDVPASGGSFNYDLVVIGWERDTLAFSWAYQANDDVNGIGFDSGEMLVRDVAASGDNLLILVEHEGRVDFAGEEAAGPSVFVLDAEIDDDDLSGSMRQRARFGVAGVTSPRLIRLVDRSIFVGGEQASGAPRVAEINREDGGERVFVLSNTGGTTLRGLAVDDERIDVLVNVTSDVAIELASGAEAFVHGDPGRGSRDVLQFTLDRAGMVQAFEPRLDTMLDEFGGGLAIAPDGARILAINQEDEDDDTNAVLLRRLP